MTKQRTLIDILLDDLEARDKAKGLPRKPDLGFNVLEAAGMIRKKEVKPDNKGKSISDLAKEALKDIPKKEGSK